MKYNHWTEDMKKSIRLFKLLIPIIQPWFGFGEFIQHEGKKDEISKKLDILWGIDYSYKFEDIFIGIASRIQFWRDRAWNTFTIRIERFTGSKTELEKRIEAIKNGDKYPKITLQAYFNQWTDEFLSVACCYTKDLYEYIEKYPKECDKKRSDNKFLAVDWDKFEKKGYPIKITNSERQCSGKLI